ncbi:hypothetical protein EUBSIR_02198 [[Eubacterium] siraeum DSM 15702]|uniref:Uncharacterized protein n=1 Tax=[Eubacterium] siraeum DSM 15702 TaxID=428128 RepID=B0MQT1_9FIRM|nr:hypothetical protein EUBSIR_02198 [[Eubacterium] siraeum DSM 15702]
MHIIPYTFGKNKGFYCLFAFLHKKQCKIIQYDSKNVADNSVICVLR